MKGGVGKEQKRWSIRADRPPCVCPVSHFTHHQIFHFDKTENPFRSYHRLSEPHTIMSDNPQTNTSAGTSAVPGAALHSRHADERYAPTAEQVSDVEQAGMGMKPIDLKHPKKRVAAWCTEDHKVEGIWTETDGSNGFFCVDCEDPTNKSGTWCGGDRGLGDDGDLRGEWDEKTGQNEIFEICDDDLFEEEEDDKGDKPSTDGQPTTGTVDPDRPSQSSQSKATSPKPEWFHADLS